MSWPCSRRRSVIPLPIRPRPIIPSCIGLLGLLDVDSRDAPSALPERRIVSRSLRRDQAAEAERLVRDGELVAEIVDDLEEKPRIRAAFVQLAGRVQIAGAVAVGDDEPAAAPQLPDEVVDALVVLLVRLDERLHADVVPLLRLREERLDRPLELQIGLAACR